MAFDTGLEKCVRRQVPLAPYTWFRLGGPARILCRACDSRRAANYRSPGQERRPRVRMLGGGSNVLVGEAGVKGVVIIFRRRPFRRSPLMARRSSQGAGAKLGPRRRQGRGGRVGRAGVARRIPGTVGGALRGNAGSRSGDIGQWTAQGRGHDGRRRDHHSPPGRTRL